MYSFHQASPTWRILQCGAPQLQILHNPHRPLILANLLMNQLGYVDIGHHNPLWSTAIVHCNSFVLLVNSPCNVWKSDELCGIQVGFVWKCWVYSQWNSNLIGIMISKTIGFRGTRHFQTHPVDLQSSQEPTSLVLAASLPLCLPGWRPLPARHSKSPDPAGAHGRMGAEQRWSVCTVTGPKKWRGNHGEIAEMDRNAASCDSSVARFHLRSTRIYRKKHLFIFHGGSKTNYNVGKNNFQGNNTKQRD